MKNQTWKGFYLSIGDKRHSLETILKGGMIGYIFQIHMNKCIANIMVIRYRIATAWKGSNIVCPFLQSDIKDE